MKTYNAIHNSFEHFDRKTACDIKKFSSYVKYHCFNNVDPFIKLLQ